MPSRYGYDISYRRRGRRYDRDYDADFGRYLSPLPGAQGYPAARWGWGPIGWGMWSGWDTGVDPAPGYGFGGGYEPPHARPEESPTYGRGGDQAIRGWSRRYGYDMEYTIRPRFPHRHR